VICNQLRRDCNKLVRTTHNNLYVLAYHERSALLLFINVVVSKANVSNISYFIFLLICGLSSAQVALGFQ
jgi:hypothetical protein